MRGALEIHRRRDQHLMTLIASVPAEVSAGKLASDLRPQGILQIAPGVRAELESLDDDAIDVQVHRHACAPAFSLHLKSASFTGRSVLRNSVRADARMAAMVTGVLVRAALNAAFNAML